MTEIGARSSDESAHTEYYGLDRAFAGDGVRAPTDRGCTL